MSTNQQQNNEHVGDKTQRVAGNCFQATGLCCFKAKEQTQIKATEFQVNQRQKKFGIDYLTLVEERASPTELRACLSQAMNDIKELQGKIQDHRGKIDEKEAEVQSKIKPAPAAASRMPDADFEPNDDNNYYQDEEPPAKNAYNSGKPYNGANSSSGRKKPGGASSPPSSTKKPSSSGKEGPRDSKPRRGGEPKPASSTGGKIKPDDDIDDIYRDADPSKWKFSEQKFAGSSSYESKGREETVKGKSIRQGITHFKANPSKYVAMLYQTTMIDWPVGQHQYILQHRAGTERWMPKGVSPSGWMTVLMHEYEALPRMKDNVLPKQHRDKYTDDMTFNRRKIHSNKIKPFLPGRGMGCVDKPNIKIIGDVDPSDIAQGQVGNCWMLSGISSLAEFDGAVKKLFRKTKKLDQRPLPSPNMYTITLWDLPTWTEVDIHIDERLCASPDGSDQLLASKPSEDGELWVCYLEKALAAHCGGWDKIVGGQCTHAWALLTGCKEQYQISKNPKSGKYMCFSKYNPLTKKWSKSTNSPHDCDGSMWPGRWPKVGGGGDKELTEDELFLRLVAWDQVNFIVGAGTTGVSDKNKTDGIVDNHAYSVIESHSGVAGTNIDLLKVRNPWGKGEIEDGEFDDDGPGWDKYPQIKKQLKPVVADDGIFWVTKKEFFQYFNTIYLSASNMTEFVED